MNPKNEVLKDYPKKQGIILKILNTVERRRRLFTTVLLFFGLSIYLVIQGYLVLDPLWGRAALPEPDDTLPYVFGTARINECFSGDCPAVQDLRAQLSTPSPDARVSRYRGWAGNVFGCNHLFFSGVILLIKGLGYDYFTAYKIIYSLSPLLFGLGFAFLLSSLWGWPAAAMGLIAMSSKVFPHSGLHWLVPWNFTMGLALFYWARIIKRNGSAPFTIGFGSVILIGMHPVGVIYSLLGIAISLALKDQKLSKKHWLPLLLILVLLLLTFLLPNSIFTNITHYLTEGLSLKGLLFQGGSSLCEVGSAVSRLSSGIFGDPAVFCGAAALGLFSIPLVKRRKVIRVAIIMALFCLVGLFFPPRQPGDVFFRLWIPLVAVLTGAVSRAGWFTLVLSFNILRENLTEKNMAEKRPPWRYWPVVFQFIFIGYGFAIVSSGLEHTAAIVQYTKNRQPLEVSQAQIDLLMSEIKPGDRVVYSSMLAMPYFLVNGGMNYGAVYYHPVLSGQEPEKTLLRADNIRFLVAYNPLVDSPSFKGKHERRWGIATPEFHFSPLNSPPRYGPMLQEDSIHMKNYKWLDIFPRTGTRPGVLNIGLYNPGGIEDLQWLTSRENGEKDSGRDTKMEVTPLFPDGRPMEDHKMVIDVPPRLKQRLEIDLKAFPGHAGLRIQFREMWPKARITALSFDRSGHNWPWDSQARISLMHKKWEFGLMTVDFDPRLLLPEPLRDKRFEVIDDSGSMVLLGLSPRFVSLPQALELIFDE